MIHPGSIRWFARHEARLAWRDGVALMTGGDPGRARRVAVAVVAIALALHGLAYLMLRDSAIVAGTDARSTRVAVTGALAMAASLMLSQALESVTRAFYARGDLELILSSPAPAPVVFAVRIGGLAATVAAMVLALGAPFIDVLAWLGGARWLAAYLVVAALAAGATAAALVVTATLFRSIGPRRTRVVAQVAAAVTGAAFAIAVQFAAILSTGTVALSPGTAARLGAAPLSLLDRMAPDGAAIAWLPARAVAGDPWALVMVLGAGAAALGATIRAFAPGFARFALAAAAAPRAPARGKRRRSRFRDASPAQALRRKEWTLLVRDPWLLSQTLMQLLYLAPAAFLLWTSFRAGLGAPALVVPILVMAAGQLGGALAWLAVSGEDAPDLVASAPMPAARVLRAKTEAVLAAIALVFAPLLVPLAVSAPLAAVVALAGIVAAARSAIGIQYWFRTQATRTLFRRRQTSSRIATFAESLSSIGWAGTGALAAAGSWLAVVPAALVFAVLAGARALSPAQRRRPIEPMEGNRWPCTPG